MERDRLEDLARSLTSEEIRQALLRDGTLASLVALASGLPQLAVGLAAGTYAAVNILKEKNNSLTEDQEYD